VTPTTDVLAKRRYCKWHDSYLHSTNKCNYFRWQVQSAINDGRLMLGDESKMKLDVGSFPMHMVGLEGKRFLVRSNQAESTNGKEVLVLDELRQRMIKPHNPEVGAWNENVRRKPVQRIKPTSGMLIEKYVRQ
jgi:hypothetical protein